MKLTPLPLCVALLATACSSPTSTVSSNTLAARSPGNDELATGDIVYVTVKQTLASAPLPARGFLIESVPCIFNVQNGASWPEARTYSATVRKTVSSKVTVGLFSSTYLYDVTAVVAFDNGGGAVQFLCDQFNSESAAIKLSTLQDAFGSEASFSFDAP